MEDCTFPILVLFVRLISVIGICTTQPFMDVDGGCKKLHVVVDVSYIDPTYIWYLDAAIKLWRVFRVALNQERDC